MKSEFDNVFDSRHSINDGIMYALDAMIGEICALVRGYDDEGRGYALAPGMRTLVCVRWYAATAMTVMVALSLFEVWDRPADVQVSTTENDMFEINILVSSKGDLRFHSGPQEEKE